MAVSFIALQLATLTSTCPGLGRSLHLHPAIPRVGVITKVLKRPGKNGRLARVQAAYFGFLSHTEASNFREYVTYHQLATFTELRVPKRLKGVTCEVKVWEMDESCIEQLAQKDLDWPPREAYLESPAVNDSFSQVQVTTIDSPPLAPRQRPMTFRGVSIA